MNYKKILIFIDRFDTNIMGLFRKKSADPLLFMYDMKDFRYEACPRCGSQNATLYYQDHEKHEFMCHDCPLTSHSQGNLFTILEQERQKHVIDVELQRLINLPLTSEENQKVKQIFSTYLHNS